MLPDISVLGQYTYLATIVFWGSIAFVLLYRLGLLRKAALTIVALYPIGYVWDWYTLHVGVFDIILHVEVYVAGIPLEEHLFIIAVPALVIAVHETLHDALDRRRERANREGL